MPNTEATCDTLPLYCCMARRIASHSVASKVCVCWLTCIDDGCIKAFSSICSGFSTLPSAIITAFSMMCCNSRILPNQGCDCNFFAASVEIVSNPRPYCILYCQGNFKECHAVFRAYGAFLKNKKKMKQKRLPVTRKPSSEIVGMYCGSIVFKHFLGKKQTSREIFG